MLKNRSVTINHSLETQIMSGNLTKKSKKNAYVAVTRHPIEQTQSSKNAYWYDNDQAFTHPIECIGLFHTFEDGVRFVLKQIFENDSVLNDDHPFEDYMKGHGFRNLPNLLEDSDIPDEQEIQDWKENLRKFRASEWIPKDEEEMFKFFEYIRHGKLLNCKYDEKNFQIEWIDLVNLPNEFPRDGVSVIYAVTKGVEFEPTPPTPRWDTFWKKK